MQVNFTINIDDKLIGRIKKFFTKRNTVAVFFVCMLGVSAMVYAATITKTWNFSTGDIIDADKINKNFDDLFSAVSALQTNNIAQFESGMMMPFAGSVAPDGWLLCDGRVIPTSAAVLISMVGSNTPDLRGRYLVGKMTETITNPSHPLYGLFEDLNDDSVAWITQECKKSPSTYSWKHQLLATEIPGHKHNMEDWQAGLITVGGGTGLNSGTNATVSFTNSQRMSNLVTDWFGGDPADITNRKAVKFPILPPSMTMNFIIKI
jgi:hypothetical protein